MSIFNHLGQFELDIVKGIFITLNINLFDISLTNLSFFFIFNYFTR